MMRATLCTALVAAAALVAAMALAVPPEPIAHPARGQSAEPQRMDEAACGQWARQKVAQASAPTSPPQPPALPNFPGLPPLPPQAADGPPSIQPRALAACMTGRGYSIK